MKQIIEIEVPEGKTAKLQDYKIIFEDIKSQLPRTWEEFCDTNKISCPIIRLAKCHTTSQKIIVHIGIFLPLTLFLKVEIFIWQCSTYRVRVLCR